MKSLLIFGVALIFVAFISSCGGNNEQEGMHSVVIAEQATNPEVEPFPCKDGEHQTCWNRDDGKLFCLCRVGAAILDYSSTTAGKITFKCYEFGTQKTLPGCKITEISLDTNKICKGNKPHGVCSIDGLPLGYNLYFSAEMPGYFTGYWPVKPGRSRVIVSSPDGITEEWLYTKGLVLETANPNRVIDFQLLKWQK